MRHGVWLLSGTEMVIAVRTAPGSSYRNPAERIMSVLNNIALYGVATERARLEPSGLETMMSSLSTDAENASANGFNPDGTIAELSRRSQTRK